MKRHAHSTNGRISVALALALAALGAATAQLSPDGRGASCAPSSLEGYTCMIALGGSADYTVHWEASDANTVRLAAAANTDSWIALGEPADDNLRMAGSRVVQASSEGVRSITLTSYSPATFVEADIPGLPPNGIEFRASEGSALLELTRTIEGGLEASSPLNLVGAFGSGPGLTMYHQAGRFGFQIDPSATPLGSAADIEVDDEDHDIFVPYPDAGAGDDAAAVQEADIQEAASCAPSSLEGYTCMIALGGSADYTVHWAASDANTVRLAAAANTDSWIALGEPADNNLRMAGSRVVQASSEGVRSITLTSYSPATFVEADIPSLPPNGIEFRASEGSALLELTRTIEGGLEASSPLNLVGAFGSGSGLTMYHQAGRFGFQIDPSAQPLEIPAPVAAFEDSVDDKAAGTVQPSTECTPSDIRGFECLISHDGVNVHWAVVYANKGSEPSSINMAVQLSMAGEGWVGVGFPAEPGSGMIGGQVLQGSPAAGLRRVELGGYSSALFREALADSPVHTAVSNESIEVVDGATTVYLTINADLQQGIDINAPVAMIMAWNPSTADISAQHSASDRIAIEIDFRSGEESSMTNNKQKFWLLHGALMFAGWGVLIPAGVTAASSFKHKDPAWFKAHRALNTIGLLLAIGGVVVALVQFELSSFSKVHAYMGFIVMILGLIQPLMAFFRPPKDGPNRFVFNYAHWIVGAAAVLLALANCGFGTYLLSQLNPDLFWVAIVYFAYLGAILCTYVVLRFVSALKWSRVPPKGSKSQTGPNVI